MLLRDFRFAVRGLLKTPGFTAVAVLVLALGIGANTAVFSLVNAMLLKPMPGAEQGAEVVGIYSRDRTKPDAYRSFSYPNFLDVRAHNPAFSDVAAMTFAMVGFKEGDQTRRVFAALVSANYFSTFRVPLALGRTFTAQEESPGSAMPVVIVSFDHWKTRGFDPHVIGSTVLLNARPFTVVGVTTPKFTAAASIVAPEFWLPTGTYEMVVNDMFRNGAHDTLADRANNTLLLYGRLKPGVDLAASQSLLAGLARQMEQAYPAENKNQDLLAHRLSRFSISDSPDADGNPATFVVLLMSMTAVVLAIACLNLANMLLARGTARRREIAIRLALGSNRSPIVRQLLVEGLLLSLAGGAFGLIIAFWTGRFLVASIAPVMPMLTISVDPAPDLRVLVFTLVFCAVSTLTFGLGPAWKLSRTDVVFELKEQGGETGRRRRWAFPARHALVVGQIALSLVLLISAGLFVRAAGAASAVDPGFSLEHSLLANVDPSIAGYDEGKGRDTYRRLLERVRHLPGVQAASIASIVPFGDMTMGRSVQKVGNEGPGAPANTGEASMSMGTGTSTPRDRGNAIGVNYYVIGAQYFDSMGIRLLRGRGFTEDEELSPSAAPRVVIDQTLAKRLFPNADPLGQYIRFTDTAERQTTPAQAAPMEIVGVAAPIRHSLLDTEVRPQVYVPFGSHYQANMFVQVRVRSASATGSTPSDGGTGTGGATDTAMLRMLRQQLRLLDDRLPVLSLRTFAQHRDASVSLWMMNTGALLFGSIGLVAVFLALVGVYGVKAYLVSRRTREIGIRMSLGATPRSVLWLVLREGVTLAATGVAIGLVLAVGVAMLIKDMVYQVSAIDPITFVTAPILVAAATLLACYIPARRAMRVTPLRALRFD